MKRLALLFVAAVAVFCLASCGDQAQKKVETKADEHMNAPAAPAPAPAPAAEKPAEQAPAPAATEPAPAPAAPAPAEPAKQ